MNYNLTRPHRHGGRRFELKQKKCYRCDKDIDAQTGDEVVASGGTSIWGSVLGKQITVGLCPSCSIILWQWFTIYKQAKRN